MQNKQSGYIRNKQASVCIIEDLNQQRIVITKNIKDNIVYEVKHEQSFFLKN
jgi:hypothetical protein